MTTSLPTVPANTTPSYTLTNIDQEQFVGFLQQSLAQTSSWTDLLPSATGSAIIDFIGTVGTFGVFANERALQEAFIDSARLQSSVLSAVRQLGVRISRKLPASVTVTLTKPADGNALYIPIYSVFTAKSIKLYNNTAITFSSTQTTKTVTLYEGYQKVVNVSGTGNPFQVFISQESNFVVADTDVVVTVNSLPIPVVTVGLWHYQAVVSNNNGVISTTPTDAVQDSSTKTGQLELTFGSTNYGTLPALNSTVTVGYCITQGASGNDLSFNGTSISIPTIPSVTGVATSILTGGADQKSVETYRRIAPSSFAAFDRAVNKVEYNAIAASYPGVLDAKLLGQQDLAPSLLSYSNLIRITLLTSSTWTQTQYNTFLSWFETRSMGYMNYFFKSPTPRNYSINAVVSVNTTSDLNTVYNNVNTALQNYVALGYGSLEKTVYVSEIYDTIRTADPGVLTVNLLSPTYNLVTAATPPTPTFTENAGGGTINAGVVTYQITSVAYDPISNTTGETLPNTVNHTVLGTGVSLTLSWTPTLGSDNFNIYVTRGGVTGLLATVSGSATSYTDTGAAPSATTPPTQTSMFVFYPNNTGITLTMQYSSDRGVGQT